MVIELNNISQIANKNASIGELWHCNERIWANQKPTGFQETIPAGPTLSSQVKTDNNNVKIWWL